MTLCCPQTSEGDVDRLIGELDNALTALLALSGSRVISS
jgi:glutamate-1-semialdehyde 2,1-aminomutase